MINAEGGSTGRLSVRAQITLWSVAVVALALTLFGVGVRVGVERILIGRTDNMLLDRAERFLRQPPPFQQQPPPPPLGGEGQPGNQPPPPWDGSGPPPQGQQGEGFGPPQGQPFRPGPARDPFPALRFDGMTGQRLLGPPDSRPYSPDGLRRAVAAAAGRGPADVGYGSDDQGQRLRVVSRPFVRQDGNVEVVQVAAPLADVEMAVSGVTRALLLLVPAALLLTAAGALLLADRVLRPVGRLAAAASGIQAADLSARLPGGDAPDEFGRLTAVLNGMLGRLETAFERQKRFAADASHELRTPLATIKAHTSLALEDGDAIAPDEAHATLKAIDGAADRAERLVRDLLLLVRAGALPVRPETVVLHDALSEAARSSLTAAGLGPRAEVTVDAPTGVVAFTDRDHLLRLVGNLLDNALRYTPKEGRVTLRASEAANGGVTVAVVDTGAGIAPEHLARLGEPFYRPDAARNRKSGGAGLGLAICQGIAGALGGTLRLDSTPGRGTTATLTLPSSPPLSAQTTSRSTA